MSHYLTKEEIEAKERELREIQERDPAYMITLVFKKDGHGWYADVPTHTRSENAMVAGADFVVERMSQGDNTVEVKFRTMPSETAGAPQFTMNRILHDSRGGTYLVHGLSMIPFPAWLCCVTHDVTGEHPEKIFVHAVNHYNR